MAEEKPTPVEISLMQKMREAAIANIKAVALTLDAKALFAKANRIDPENPFPFPDAMPLETFAAWSMVQKWIASGIISEKDFAAATSR